MSIMFEHSLHSEIRLSTVTAVLKCLLKSRNELTESDPSVETQSGVIPEKIDGVRSGKGEFIRILKAM